MSSKARRADYSIFFPVDSSPGEEAKEIRTTKPRALKSWDRHGARAASQPSPIREPLYHPALGTTSLWTRLLGGDEPDPQPSRCHTSQGLLCTQSFASSSFQKDVHCLCFSFSPGNVFFLLSLCSLLLRLGYL